MVAPLTGFFQSFVPVASPMKFSTPTGALSGNSVQFILPTVVSMMAVGFADATCTGVPATLGFAIVLDFGAGAACVPELDCAHPANPAPAIIIRTANTLRMDAPEALEITSRIARNVALYDSERRRFLTQSERTIPGNLFRTRGSLSLHLVAHAFHFAEDAQQIAAENFLDVVGAVTAIEQRLRDLRQVGG